MEKTYLTRERRAGVKVSLSVEEETEGGLGGLDGKYTNTATNNTPAAAAPAGTMCVSVYLLRECFTAVTTSVILPSLISLIIN